MDDGRLVEHSVTSLNGLAQPFDKFTHARMSDLVLALRESQSDRDECLGRYVKLEEFSHICVQT